MALCGLVSLVLASAVRGQPWAIGATAGLASLGALLVFHPLAFALARYFARVRRRMAPPQAGSSPFATAGPPRQILPPSSPPE
jgi:integral membrane sensor domain MASE1